MRKVEEILRPTYTPSTGERVVNKPVLRNNRHLYNSVNTVNRYCYLPNDDGVIVMLLNSLLLVSQSRVVLQKSNASRAPLSC